MDNLIKEVFEIATEVKNIKDFVEQLLIDIQKVEDKLDILATPKNFDIITTLIKYNNINSEFLSKEISNT